MTIVCALFIDKMAENSNHSSLVTLLFDKVAENLSDIGLYIAILAVIITTGKIEWAFIFSYQVENALLLSYFTVVLLNTALKYLVYQYQVIIH